MKFVKSAYRKIIIASILVLLSFFVGLHFPFISQTSHLSIPIAHAQSCQLPTQVQNVAVTFPSCVGSSCNFTQGSCSWTNVSGATGSTVTVTEVETNSVVQTQQFDTSTTTTTFPVKETNTYRCDVSAINACGTGPAGTSSLLCSVQAGVATPTTAPGVPTVAPVGPTAVPVVQQPLPVTGRTDSVLFIGLGSFLLIGIGMSLFIL